MSAKTPIERHQLIFDLTLFRRDPRCDRNEINQFAAYLSHADDLGQRDSRTDDERIRSASDFHKELFGHRPAHLEPLADTTALRLFNLCAAYLAFAKTVPAIRERLVASGWSLPAGNSATERVKSPTNLSAAANALVDRIRAGDPAAIAPEVYGLDERLKGEPASIVLELIGTSPAELRQEYPDPKPALEEITPREGETFKQWYRRVEESCNGIELGFDRYSDFAYAAIGYDWVDWKWLPKGQNTYTMNREIAVEQSSPEARTQQTV